VRLAGRFSPTSGGKKKRVAKQCHHGRGRSRGLEMDGDGAEGEESRSIIVNEIDLQTFSTFA